MPKICINTAFWGDKPRVSEELKKIFRSLENKGLYSEVNPPSGYRSCFGFSTKISRKNQPPVEEESVQKVVGQVLILGISSNPPTIEIKIIWGEERATDLFLDAFASALSKSALGPKTKKS